MDYKKKYHQYKTKYMSLRNEYHLQKGGNSAKDSIFIGAEDFNRLDNDIRSKYEVSQYKLKNITNDQFNELEKKQSNSAEPGQTQLNEVKNIIADTMNA